MRYCLYCGSLLEEHLTNRYNGETGEQRKERHCPNLDCQEGCEFAGHQWGKFWKFENWEKCQRCGYVIRDY